MRGSMSDDKLYRFLIPPSWLAGVIGRRMKMEAFLPAIPEIAKTLGSTQADGHRAAVAITTTGGFLSCGGVCTDETDAQAGAGRHQGFICSAD